MSRMRSRTVFVMPANASLAFVVTSPTTWTCPVVTRVSTATRECGSSASSASSTESLMASQILSGCPSVTDSLVNSRPSLTVSFLSLQLSQKKLVNQIICVPCCPQARPPVARTPYAHPVMCVRSPAAVVQEGHDRVHDTAGHQSFRTVLQRGLGAVGGQKPTLVA